MAGNEVVTNSETFCFGSFWFFSATLVILSIVLILSAASSALSNERRAVSPAEYLSYALRTASYGILIFVTIYERYCHITSSGITFAFWFVTVLCDIFPVYTKVMLKGYEEFPLEFYLFLTIFLVEMLVLLLHCPADNYGVTEYRHTTSPEVKASFINKALFLWIWRTMFIGWRRELTSEDFFDANPRDRSDTLIPPFEKAWKDSMVRLKRKGGERSSVQTSYLGMSNEKEPLLAGFQKQSYGEKPGDDYFTDIKGNGKRAMPSLLRILFKLEGMGFLKALILKIVSDIFFFSSPMILSLLIDYANDSEKEHVWHGYALTFLLFIAMFFKALFVNNSVWRGELVGIHIKTTLISAMFKKTLTMNNKARQQYTAGEIINLMTVDTTRIQNVMNIFFFVWATPYEIVVVVVVLYQYIGWSVLAGIGALVLAILFNTLIAKRLQALQKESMKLKDERLRLVNEALTGMKVVKLYAWEPAFQDRITDVRRRELNVMLKIAYYNAVVGIVFNLTPYLVTLATFTIYVKSSDENILDANKVFLTLSYFGILKGPMNLLPSVASLTVQAVVSIHRINKFLCSEDLSSDNITRDPDSNWAILVENGSFTWDTTTRPTLKHIDLKITDGSLTAVVGAVGSGKTSLMSALLGEMEKLSGHVCLKGSVAYVQQQAWIQNATIRDNILFGQPFDKQKYQQVLFACALERDLKILSAGDMTEIGEKGINLSGGQKQRVSLARAVYSQADVYILDDPLSAVDSHVGKHIFHQVISKQGILRDKTRVLVTHGINWLPLVDTVLVMEDGYISEAGSYLGLMSHNGPFAQFIRNFLLHADDDEDDNDSDDDRRMRARVASDLETLSPDPSTTSDDKLQLSHSRRRRRGRRFISSNQTPNDDESLRNKIGRLVMDEKMEKGKVKLSVYFTYATVAGVVPILASIALLALFHVVSGWANFWLSDWTQDTTLTNASLQGGQQFQDKQNYYLSVYGALGVLQVIILTIAIFLYWPRMVVAAKRLHLAILTAIFRCPMAFFDTTPIGRILNRFSRDIEMVDNSLPMFIMDFIVTFDFLLTILVVISINTPPFLAIVVPVITLYLLIQMFYISTSRQVKRLEAVTQSPINSHFSETLSGVSSIRAYQKLDMFVQESKKRLDRNRSFYFLSISVQRAVSLYMDMLGSVVVLGSALFAVLNGGISGAVIGLSVSYAMQTSSMVWLVRMMSEIETNIISVERLEEYSRLEPEAEWILPKHRPPKNWPKEGNLVFKDYKTRYREGLSLVLKGITCSFRSGEKIGIVGRTGAGKSSLALAMFRLIEASEGAIFVDGVQISDIGLHDVRSRLTILPQDPVLFYGSLRMNLDPIGQHKDDQLWQALTTAHLKDFVQNLPGKLDYQVGEEGQSLSVGQRQLVCLARALLKKTKILILDEATAAVDMETDQLIQDTIRVEFDQCTIISIAHRLNTIMDYDRIMVLENGLVKEMDTPTRLLTNTRSTFYAMAKDANLI